MSLSPEALSALLDTAAAPWSVLYRQDGRSPWVLVATAPTHAAAVALIGAGGRRGGDWLLSQAPAAGR